MSSPRQSTEANDRPDELTQEVLPAVSPKDSSIAGGGEAGTQDQQKPTKLDEHQEPQMASKQGKVGLPRWLAEAGEPAKTVDKDVEVLEHKGSGEAAVTDEMAHDPMESSTATLKPGLSTPTISSYKLSPIETTYLQPAPNTFVGSQPHSRSSSTASTLLYTRSKDQPERSPTRSDAGFDEKNSTSEDERESGSRSEIQSIMDQFSEEGQGPGHEEVMSPRLEVAGPLLGSPIQHPPRKSSLEPLNSSSVTQGFQDLQISGSSPSNESRHPSDIGPAVPPKPGSIRSFGTPRMSENHSDSISPPLHRPPPPEPEPDLPFDFHRFLEQLRHRTADPVAKFLRSFLQEFGKKQWMVHEQVKIIGDFLAFITTKMGQCDVWREVSDAEFDNAREGMEKLVMNRLYTQTFSPEIPLPQPIPGSKSKRRGAERPMGPGRRGQHQEDVERDEILAQKVSIYGWIREEHLDIQPVGESGKRFLILAQQELLKIKTYRAPRDKIICVLNCCKVIFGLLKHSKTDSSADSFMPLLIYVVLQANPEHLVSNVQYILRFRNQDKLGGEAGYYLSSLMGAVQFIENLDRTTLTISDEEFEHNVEAAVSAIAEKHEAEAAQATSPTQLSEKTGSRHPDVTSRQSIEGESSTPRKSTSSNENESGGEASEEKAAMSGLLRSIQRPLSSIGRIFSEDSSSNTGPVRTPLPGNTPRASPAPRISTDIQQRAALSREGSARSRLTAEDSAARQASAEAAEAHRIQRAEHTNIVDTLAGMFPDLDRDIISDVVTQKEGRHWRYISSFHGPWLQLPPEVLESLANNNYTLPRPRPIDPAVFFDILKIRQLVDDATNLAVRAASGVAASNVTNNPNYGLPGVGGHLGLGLGGGGTAKLSKERKHRMREQATQKLSKAYHLDEIACSVATMQSASTLEDVAQIVLQRNPNDPDAKYVHFFHEKIPSRQLAECTSLQPLDEVIAERPSEGEILRTRAVTKIFKDDFAGAAQDLTAALQVCRYYQNQHKAGRQQLQLASEAAAAAKAQQNSRWKEEFKLDEEDHPSSLESQLLFHRAGVYLTIACQHVNAALPPKPSANGVKSSSNGVNKSTSPNGVNGTLAEHVSGDSKLPDEPVEMTPAEKEAHRKRLEARKIVKTNAKRALRDYISFVSHLDYTPGLSVDITEEFVQKVNAAVNSDGRFQSRPQNRGKSLDLESNASLSTGQLSDALIPHSGSYSSRSRNQSSTTRSTADLPILPSPTVYQISTLFSATPPADLPPYPETATHLSTKQQLQASQTDAGQALLAQTECHEALTYHPLLTDALHSLLLCHCFVQTSARELQRHAHMVARLARVCDGYPIFQAARSPSRADWIEVVRRNDNWIQLSQSWESLCAPAPLPGQVPANLQKETAAEKKERLKQQAIMEALEDDRVHDEESFHAAVAARQRRQEEEARKAEGREMPKRWAQEDGKEYPISTERAHAIVRWIREAPLGGEAGGPKKKKKGTKASAKGKGKDVEEEMAVLNIEDVEEYEKVEEEVD